MTDDQRKEIREGGFRISAHLQPAILNLLARLQAGETLNPIQGKALRLPNYAIPIFLGSDEEARLLFGDPSVPVPQGVLTAKMQKN